MAFKMKAGKEGPMYKNFPGAFKAVGDEKAKKQAASRKETIAAVAAGKAKNELDYAYRNLDRETSSEASSYTPAQRKKMIELGIDPKDRMKYAAENF